MRQSNMRKSNKTKLAGAGAVACAACGVGPVLGLLAAIGVGTATGFALFGLVSLAAGALAVTFVLLRRRRQAAAGCSTAADPVPVQLSVARLHKS